MTPADLGDNTQIDRVVPGDRLEVAFDTMVDKLKELHRSLDPEEQAAFMELLESAKAHTDSIQARNEGGPYDKPIQVHATYAMKEKMKKIPEIIREREDE